MNWIIKYKDAIMFMRLLIVLTISPNLAMTQDDRSGVHALLEKVQRSYRNASYLAFNVDYRYANARNPEKKLETVSGEVAMDKDRSRFVLDRTETISDKHVSIHILHDSKMIYLAAPQHAAVMDPLAMLDSVMAHGKNISATILPGTSGSTQVLTLQFPPGGSYSRVQMVINQKSGLLESITFNLRATDVVGQEMINRPGNPAPYEQEGKVEILFSNYRKGDFGDELFNESKYFTKVGDRYEPAAAYKDYHIFLASSNL